MTIFALTVLAYRGVLLVASTGGPGTVRAHVAKLLGGGGPGVRN